MLCGLMSRWMIPLRWANESAPADLRLRGEMDVRHPAGTELALDGVAPGEDAADQGVSGGHTVPTSRFRRWGQEALHQLLGDRGGNCPAEAIQLVLDGDCSC